MAITHYQAEQIAEQMLLVYEQAEAEMLRKMSNRLARGLDSPNWTSKKLTETVAMREQLQQSLHKLQADRSLLLTDGVKLGFTSGNAESLASVQELVEALGLSPISPNSAKVASILSETSMLFAESDRMILRKAGDAYTDIIGLASSQVATGTITLKQAVTKAMDDFAKRGITSFVDKNGGAWEMSTYAEMATITAISKATLVGYVDTMQSYGFDLAIISSHSGACPLCVAWEDVIISVSGTSDKYPSLDDAENAGVFHPRCLHHLSTYYEGVTKEGRAEPREVEEPSLSYTERSRQRYMERQIRQWKRRMAAAIDPETERYSYAYVRKWQAAIRMHLHMSRQFLPRKYSREGGRVLLSQRARNLNPVAVTPVKPTARRPLAKAQ